MLTKYQQRYGRASLDIVVKMDIGSERAAPTPFADKAPIAIETKQEI
jgi:hypothetical protein